MRHLQIITAALMWILMSVGAGSAASSPVYQSDRITARLITAERGVSEGAESISAALVIELAKGWKTYWKSPGQVGYPPSIEWDGSYNLFSAKMMFPAPLRFRAFDIENYGYETSVTYPLRLLLEQPGAAADLRASVSLLVCEELCVPENFTLDLSLFAESGVDHEDAALVADAIAALPDESGRNGLQLTSVHLDDDRSVLSASLTSDQPLNDPQIFPDLGLEAAFGAPEWQISPDLLSATVRMPVLAVPENFPQLELVLVDEARAASFLPEFSQAAPASSAGVGLLSIIAMALLGGLILNVMPCVLPVLSIKLTSALKASGQSPARIRAGFAMSALGVLAFMWVLVAILISIRAAGGQIGWGIQFQNPVFLSIMLSIVVLFAANMFGLFEIALPQSWNTRLAQVDGQPGLAGDFATGALAAVLATPCSAPFLGTAVTFALAGSSIEALAVFTALGIGLALPYLLVALRPSLVQALPRPGRWMIFVKWIMGALLALTALWLANVLGGVAGWPVVGIIAALLGAGLLATLKSAPVAALAVVAAMILPAFVEPPAARVQSETSNWSAFAPNDVAGLVSGGEVIFIDVTADWCLTCKTNKALVLDQDVVTEALTADGVTMMQADWTRPNDQILSYLQMHGRFGIPFNIVYGPGAPDGIALPEILTRDVVLQAMEDARG